jgi:hypothetical protein
MLPTRGGVFRVRGPERGHINLDKLSRCREPRSGVMVSVRCFCQVSRPIGRALHSLIRCALCTSLSTVSLSESSAHLF